MSEADPKASEKIGQASAELARCEIYWKNSDLIFKTKLDLKIYHTRNLIRRLEIIAGEVAETGEFASLPVYRVLTDVAQKLSVLSANLRYTMIDLRTIARAVQGNGNFPGTFFRISAGNDIPAEDVIRELSFRQRTETARTVAFIRGKLPQEEKGTAAPGGNFFDEWKEEIHELLDRLEELNV